MEQVELGNTMVTVGTDIKRKFAWCIREINGRKCLCIHERDAGLSAFNEEDFITAILIEQIEMANKLYR